MEKNAKMLAFVEAVSESLIAGNKYPVAGFGTFSTCSRKDKNGNIVCTIAMFRASKELREFFLEGKKPELADQHRALVSSIIERMKIDNRADVPGLGCFEVQKPNSGNAKLVFAGSAELNEELSK